MKDKVRTLWYYLLQNNVLKYIWNRLGLTWVELGDNGFYTTHKRASYFRDRFDSFLSLIALSDSRARITYYATPSEDLSYYNAIKNHFTLVNRLQPKITVLIERGSVNKKMEFMGMDVYISPITARLIETQIFLWSNPRYTRLSSRICSDETLFSAIFNWFEQYLAM